MDGKPVSLKPTDLLIDLKNPRIEPAATGQREALRALAQDQQERLAVLAEHIVEHGQFNPAELPIVMRSEEQPKRYTVLEGNRRLTALRALETPDLFKDALEPKVLERLRKLHVQYQRSPITQVFCIVAKDRDEADPWIMIRHNGQNGGAGVVDWVPDQKARYGARSGRAVGLHTRVLNFLQEGGHLSSSERKQVPTTTLERMLKSSAIRQVVGFDVEKGGALRFLVDERDAIRALMQIINDLISGETKVQHVYTKEQRIEYAQSFPAALKAQPAKTSGLGGNTAAPAQQPGAAPSVKRPAAVRITPPRAKLIPSECFLRVKDSRVKSIEIELRGLLLEDYPNAIAVLFRVFLELSVDYYRKHTLRRDQYAVKAHLADKLLDVVGDLETKGELTKWEANPVRTAAQKNSFFVPSVVMMHEVIHNLHQNPSPTDLRAQWDSLQPFIVAIWPR